MTRRSADTDLDVTTWIVEAELADGMQVCFPLADATLISVGRNGSALVDQRLFLEEYLRWSSPTCCRRWAIGSSPWSWCSIAATSWCRGPPGPCARR